MIDFSLPKFMAPIGIALALNIALMIYPVLTDKQVCEDNISSKITVIKGTVYSGR